MSVGQQIREHLGKKRYKLEETQYIFDRDNAVSRHKQMSAEFVPPPWFNQRWWHHPNNKIIPEYNIKIDYEPTHMQFIFGGSLNGFGFHTHNAAWNELIIGKKRWALIDPKGKGPLPHYGVQESQTRYLERCSKRLGINKMQFKRGEHVVEKEGCAQSLDCMQLPGDVIQVPEHFLHAVVNLGDTMAIAQNQAFYVDFRPVLFIQAARGQLLTKNINIHKMFVQV